MNDHPVPMSGGGSPADRESWRALLRSMLGEEAAEEAMRALEESGFDPGALAQAAGLPTDPGAMAGFLAQLQRFLSADGGPVNWTLAHDVARQTAAQGGDPSVTAAQAAQVTAALTAADLWLDAATELAPAGAAYQAWSRADWVESTLPTWRRLAEPIAASVAQALVDALGAENADALGPGGIESAGGMIRQLGGAVFGMQVGQAVGTLAGEVFGASDTGLPLLEKPGAALLPVTIDAYAAGLDAPDDEIRHFLAVREAAHARLFAQVPWLRAHLLGTVEAYARGIEIDTARLEEAVRSIDTSDPEALREALASGVFAPERTPPQEAALLRLETALALVEGWVEHVTALAVAPHLPHGIPLREMLRRRRAAGGPAEQTFSALVGLELRPRRARDAALLWATVEQNGGIAARDALWAHPDLLPTAEDLDDAAGFVRRQAAARRDEQEIDAALASLFDQAEGRSPGTTGRATGATSGETGSGAPGQAPPASDPDDGGSLEPPTAR